jgi:hypothetical protein
MDAMQKVTEIVEGMQQQVREADEALAAQLGEMEMVTAEAQRVLAAAAMDLAAKTEAEADAWGKKLSDPCVKTVNQHAVAQAMLEGATARHQAMEKTAAKAQEQDRVGRDEASRERDQKHEAARRHALDDMNRLLPGVFREKIVEMAELLKAYDGVYRSGHRRLGEPEDDWSRAAKAAAEGQRWEMLDRIDSYFYEVEQAAKPPERDLHAEMVAAAGRRIGDEMARQSMESHAWEEERKERFRRKRDVQAGVPPTLPPPKPAAVVHVTDGE